MPSIQLHRNRWRVKWHLDGRAVYESFATKAEADDAARRIEARTVLDGRPPDTTDQNTVTFARWWARWEPGRPWRESSRKVHASHYRNYLEPVFGRVALTEITTADVNRLHRVLERRGLAPATVAAVHTTFSSALQGAVDDGLLTRNPARYARLRRARKPEAVVLDAATVAALLDAVEQTTPALHTFARVIASTGLRRAEASGLTWDRIDLDTGVLLIDRQLDRYAPNQPAWCATKNTVTRRVVLTDSTVALLRAHRAAQPVVVLDGTGLVFTQPDGRHWTHNQLGAAWHRAAKVLQDAGTPLPAGANGWHCLRHTTAARLVEAGVPPKEAADMLGHSPAMLLATYAHVVDRSAADARLRAALDGGA
jgi:integrase